MHARVKNSYVFCSFFPAFADFPRSFSTVGVKVNLEGCDMCQRFSRVGKEKKCEERINDFEGAARRENRVYSSRHDRENSGFTSDKTNTREIEACGSSIFAAFLVSSRLSLPAPSTGRLSSCRTTITRRAKNHKILDTRF